MTSNNEASGPVVKRVTVACSPAEAFRFFTEAFDHWWPKATHSCIAFASGRTDRPAFVSFEARVGGSIVEQGRGGEQYVWGTVLEWQPPSRVAFTWHPGRPPDTAQRVEVSFEAVPDGTSVVLAHTEWHRLGTEAHATRDSYDKGWEHVLGEAFTQFVQRQAT